MSKWFTENLKIKTYKNVGLSCDNKTMRGNNALTKKYQKSFLKQEIIWQTCYGLPKIRKSQTMSKEIEEKVLDTFLVSNQKI